MAVRRRHKTVWESLQHDQEWHGNCGFQVRRYPAYITSKRTALQGAGTPYSRKIKARTTKKINIAIKGKQFNADAIEGKITKGKGCNSKGITNVR